jgi:hypothetical protein
MTLESLSLCKIWHAEMPGNHRIANEIVAWARRRSLRRARCRFDLGGVENAADFTATVAPGSIAAAFGNFLLTSPQGDLGLPLTMNLADLIAVSDRPARLHPLTPWSALGNAAGHHRATGLAKSDCRYAEW